MAEIDKYFNPDTPIATHPKMRVWKPLIESKPFSIQCEIQRKREGLGFLPAKIYLLYKLTERDLPQSDHDDWDDGLNLFLIQNGVAAIDEQNEAVRFNLMLSKLLQNIEVRNGEGYFNAVLIIVVESDFGSDRDIAKMLKKVGPGNPNRGRVYADVVASIRGAIKNCADYLVKDLHYPVGSAQWILTETVKGYFDERFSITNQKLLGWD